MANDPLIIDTELREDPNVLQPKTIYAGDVWTDQPYISVQQDSIILTASKNQGIAISDEFGITIGGKASFSMMPDQISMGGGYWRLNPLLVSCIPSTTPTPIPTFVKDTPRLLKARTDVQGAVSALISNSDAAV